MKLTDSAIIVGGGFYGCAIGIHLAQRGLKVLLLEKEKTLLSKASYVNQARLHNGYHYPRSFRTALRSHANLPMFRELYRSSIEERFGALYAIASRGSKVSSRHFRRFCKAADIPLKPAKSADLALFDSNFVDEVYEVSEPAFNADLLREELTRQLTLSGVQMRLGAAVESVKRNGGDGRELLVQLAGGERLNANWVLNCTYAALNHIDGRSGVIHPHLRHQIAEVALIEPPAELRNRGITLMDGPFFSTMPFPARKLHSLTHVQHTPHVTWPEGGAVEAVGAGRKPDDILQEYLCVPGGPQARSRIAWMIRDACRFVPILAQAKHVESLFAVKTLVASTQIDDARPILFERQQDMPRFISVLGSKLDNIFDVLNYLDEAICAAI